MITNKLKETLSHKGKFITLSLTIAMLEKCIILLRNYGISDKTISFLVIGYEKISEELKEGYNYVKNNEDFKDIIKGF